jgi:hypothetical protein
MIRHVAALAALSLLACAEPVAHEPLAPPPPEELGEAAPPAVEEQAAPDAGVSTGPGAATAEAPAPRRGEMPVAPVAPDAWIVWARDAEGGARSFWVQPDGAGRFEGMANDGIVLAVDGALFHWAVHEEALVTSMDCELIDAPAVGGTGARAVLERIDAEGAVELVTPDREGAFAANDWRETVGLEASIGPYLFVHRSVWGYHCGAHGGSTDAFVVFDARTGEPARLEAPPSQAVREAAWDALASAELFEPGPQGLAQTLFRPVFDEHGALRIEHQLTADSCYACSDGRWDSYTVSARVRGGAVPAELAAFADVPPDVLALVRERWAPAAIGGVSRAAPELLPAFEQRVVPDC